ncbi:MAG: hypothetical protein ACKVVP_23740 [Chloroflexota bacterium]
MPTLSRQVELPLATVVTVIGIVMTSSALLTHAALLVAPGAMLITLGGVWLGNALARHGVVLFPGARTDAREVEE